MPLEFEEISIGTIKVDIQKVYPELEDLEVTPTGEEQNFKSSKYGYDNVTVKAVETEELNVTSSLEKQTYEGLYGKVNIEGIVAEELNIVPSTEKQINEGLYRKVTVEGDSKLLPENIKKGVSLFGVEGTANTANFKITNASYLFYMGARLEYLKVFLSLCENVTSTEYMFRACNNLTELDLNDFDTSKVTTMSNMFRYCNNLTELDLSNFNTSNVTDMNYMFANCSNLTELDLSSFSAEKVTIISSCLSNCYDIVNLKFMKNLGKGYNTKRNNVSEYKISFYSCNNLNHESLMDIINNLYDLNLTYGVENGGTLYTQSLEFNSKTLPLLTPEEIAIATSKGWTVS